jgi:TPR repeat protein
LPGVPRRADQTRPPGTNFAEEDNQFIETLEEKLDAVVGMASSFAVNTRENAQLTFDRKVRDHVQDMIDVNFKFFKQINDKPEFAGTPERSAVRPVRGAEGVSQVMAHERRPFQKHSRLFHTLILQTLASSAEYQGAADMFDSLLLLADRILVACEQDPEFGRVAQIGESIAQIQATPDTTKVEQQLLQETELWLKAIVRLALPQQYSQLRETDERKKTRRFNLFGSIQALGLLQHEQLDLRPDEWQKISDPVRQAIFLAKEDRNPITHDTATLDYATRMRTLPGALLTLIAPIFKHREALRHSLRQLITNFARSAEIQGVAQTVSSERGGHLSSFAGRIEWIKLLKRKLEQDPTIVGGYLLLTAEEGTGKSALCAKLTEELRPGGEVLGAAAGSVGRLMPWLPGPVLHFGKSSKDPEEIVRFLLAQINAMVIEPIPFPTLSAAAAPSLFPANLERVGASGHIVMFGDWADMIGKYWRSAGQDRSLSQARAGTFGGVAPIDQFRRVLYQALEVLAEERGAAVLVIDAIEEITIDGSGLAFLPARLPPGVCGLLTGRPGTPAEKWARENLNVIESIALRCLERVEIPLLTGVPDDTQEQITFNDRVLRETAGLPLLVSRVARRVRANLGDLAGISVEGSLDEIFARQANEWMQLGPLGKEVLILLALYEPVAPLSLRMAQDFLERRNMDVPDLPELRSELKPVTAQMQGLDVQRVKLAIRPFAEYVRERCFSERDIQPRLQAIVSMLARRENVEPGVVASFLQFWTTAERPKVLRSTAEGLIDQMIDERKANRLSAIARPSWKKPGPVPAFAVRCMEASAELGHAWAMTILGDGLLEGDKLPSDAAEGQRWLRKAAEAGFAPAMRDLGNRLLEGDKLPSDAAEGERWLRKAAETGNKSSMAILGSRLLEGYKLPSDAAEGQQWLRKAAKAGFAPAMAELGDRLLEGDKLSSDAAEGERWLRKAAETGNEFAMAILGNRLLEGRGLAADAAEGERWLRKAAEAGFAPAMRVLGNRLLEGDKLSSDAAEGERWLRKAAEAEDGPAMAALGDRLLNGDQVLRNTSEGGKWLRKALQAGNARAATVLGIQAYRSGDFASAADLFRKGYELGGISAGINLAYVKRRSELPGDIQLPPIIDLLSKGITEKSVFALLNYALCLASGIQCTINWDSADRTVASITEREEIAEALDWWHNCASQQDPEGHLVLGMLARHGFISDPDGWTVAQRLRAARAGGWDVPDWMLDPVA